MYFARTNHSLYDIFMRTFKMLSKKIKKLIESIAYVNALPIISIWFLEYSNITRKVNMLLLHCKFKFNDKPIIIKFL